LAAREIRLRRSAIGDIDRIVSKLEAVIRLLSLSITPNKEVRLGLCRARAEVEDILKNYDSAQKHRGDNLCPDRPRDMRARSAGD
jgi:hypothetical protein